MCQLLGASRFGRDLHAYHMSDHLGENMLHSHACEVVFTTPEWCLFVFVFVCSLVIHGLCVYMYEYVKKQKYSYTQVPDLLLHALTWHTLNTKRFF